MPSVAGSQPAVIVRSPAWQCASNVKESFPSFAAIRPQAAENATQSRGLRAKRARSSLTMISRRAQWHGVDWGGEQLTANGLARCVHVISNAGEQFLEDMAIAKKTHAKIILVADDAGPSMRASGVPVVRMQAMSSDAMGKKLFLDLEWLAEEAAAAARAAKGAMLRQGRLPRRRATLRGCQPTAKRHRARELSARSLCRCVDRAQPRTALRKY